MIFKTKLFYTLSIFCSVVYLFSGWVWAYCAALFVLPIGILGLIFSRIAFSSNQFKITLMHRIAIYLNICGYISSGVALVLTR
jgi:hypothetical protein